jgi:two-component system, sensor histidine kinase PdtaS
MSEIVAEHTALADEEHQQLRLLVSEWQLLADLAFSDLVLWVPVYPFWDASGNTSQEGGPGTTHERAVHG